MAPSVQELLKCKEEYYKFCREERNIAAIFYHTLLLPGNLREFLKLIDECEHLDSCENASIYFEYAYLRDLWKKKFPNDSTNLEEKVNQNNRKAKKLILRFLNLPNGEDLFEKSVCDFNSYFGAMPTSKKYIQMPSRWSAKHYKKNINDDCLFEQVCMLKWAFNAKPDIVIDFDGDAAVCVEAKWESGVPSYSVKSQSGKSVTPKQTDIQKYMFDRVLGRKTKFVLLKKTRGSESKTHEVLTWSEVFCNMDISKCPEFVKDWVNHIENKGQQ